MPTHGRMSNDRSNHSSLEEDTELSYDNPNEMAVIRNQVSDLQSQIFELTNAIKGMANAQSNASASSSSSSSSSLSSSLTSPLSAASSSQKSKPCRSLSSKEQLQSMWKDFAPPNKVDGDSTPCDLRGHCPELTYVYSNPMTWPVFPPISEWQKWTTKTGCGNHKFKFISEIDSLWSKTHEAFLRGNDLEPYFFRALQWQRARADLIRDAKLWGWGDALEARALSSSSNMRKPRQAYHCPTCGGHHQGAKCPKRGDTTNPKASPPETVEATFNTLIKKGWTPLVPAGCWKDHPHYSPHVQGKRKQSRSIKKVVYMSDSSESDEEVVVKRKVTSKRKKKGKGKAKVGWPASSSSSTSSE